MVHNRPVLVRLEGQGKLTSLLVVLLAGEVLDDPEGLRIPHLRSVLHNGRLSQGNLSCH